MVTLYLCSIPFLDSNNTLSIDFENADSQRKYFTGKNIDIIPNVNIQSDGERESVTVKKNIKSLEYCDYLFFQGEDGNYYYYFITNKLFKNASNTILELELDVIQTYMFQYYWLDSFVDRCHVDRWKRDGTPTENLEDEGIQPTSMVRAETKMLKKMNNNIIYVTSEPIEYNGTSSEGDGGGDTGSSGGGSSGGGTGPNSGDWSQGIPSKDMFRFLKGFEGYGPYQYNDSGGTPTIGYGITNSEPDVFNRLKGQQPCSEEVCAKEAWEILIKNYGKPIVNAVKKLGCTQQRQFDALLDLAYNGGTDLVINSKGNRDLANIIKKNPNDETAIRKVWENYWVSDGIKPQPGLVARRKAECNMYFGKPYEVRTIPKLGTGGNITGSFSGDGWLPK